MRSVKAPKEEKARSIPEWRLWGDVQARAILAWRILSRGLVVRVKMSTVIMT